MTETQNKTIQNHVNIALRQINEKFIKNNVSKFKKKKKNDQNIKNKNKNKIHIQSILMFQNNQSNIDQNKLTRMQSLEPQNSLIQSINKNHKKRNDSRSS